MQRNVWCSISFAQLCNTLAHSAVLTCTRNIPLWIWFSCWASPAGGDEIPNNVKDTVTVAAVFMFLPPGFFLVYTSLGAVNFLCKNMHPTVFITSLFSFGLGEVEITHKVQNDVISITAFWEVRCICDGSAFMFFSCISTHAFLNSFGHSY